MVPVYDEKFKLQQEEGKHIKTPLNTPSKTQTESNTKTLQGNQEDFSLQSEKPNSSDAGECSQKYLCAKPLRDLIEELVTFTTDEDMSNDNDTEQIATNESTCSEGSQGSSTVAENYDTQNKLPNKVYSGNVATVDSTQTTGRKVLNYIEEDKYKCSVCNKLFNSSKSYKKHHCLKSKATDGPTQICFDDKSQRYKCDECGESFDSENSYLRHKRSICKKHHCIFCDFKGRSPIAVRVHCVKKHGKYPKLKDGCWVYE